MDKRALPILYCMSKKHLSDDAVGWSSGFAEFVGDLFFDFHQALCSTKTIIFRG